MKDQGSGFVGLAEVIRQVREELEQARSDGNGHEVLFAVDSVNLEFSVQVHRTGTAGGGLRIGVVTAELGGTVDRATTHQVQVQLKPQPRDDDGLPLVIGRNQTTSRPAFPAS